jgi:hypothetical protein
MLPGTNDAEVAINSGVAKSCSCISLPHVETEFAGDRIDPGKFVTCSRGRWWGAK